MLPWKNRPIEVANLLNPAFCSILLRDSIESFQKERNNGMPYPLSLLVLPIVLHKVTRQSLPRTARTRLHMWLQDKPEARVGFANRTRQLVPYTKEALIFGMHQGLISIDAEGYLISVDRRLKKPSWPARSEPDICRKKAKFLGRWFAQAGDTSTIFTMWGIRL